MPEVYLNQELDVDDTPTGFYKIGHTKRTAEERTREYRAGNFRGCPTIHVVKVEDSQAVETQLHRHYASYRMKGHGGGDEWFNFSTLPIDSVVKTMNGYGRAICKQRFAIAHPSTVSSGRYYSDLDDDDRSGSPVGMDEWLSKILWALVSVILLLAIGNTKTVKNLPFSSSGLGQSSQCMAARIDLPSLEGLGQVNLRSTPNGSVVGKLNSGDLLQACEFSADGEWRKVKFGNGNTGWISSRFIK